ncbi:MAG TPA: helix-turn-helix domain-containing protein [Candidatus Eisenbergiella merdipullorum]|uniref:Helix-turn-helix domain-containing protein n=1 Tax=Candidatus Eisenbergiella merdipullorum TaxID=2838553 RepID=A0A9D2I1L5_9FIRM|nr:helix-turn-helix domain-containing protein [Candidatus Eisenbergiella merdipullorum]
MQGKKSVGKILSDVRDWIISYLIVLIIPIVICSVFFLYTYLTIWEETSDSNAVALQIIASELDGIFEKIVAVEYNIQNNDNIRTCESLTPSLDADKRYQLIKASEALNECIGSGNDIITSWQLFYPNNEFVLLVGKAYTDMAGSYMRLGESMGYSEKDWETLLKQHNDRKILGNPEEGLIIYLTSLPRYGKTVKKNVIFTLNMDHIQEILSKLDNMKSSGILLVNGENAVLASRNMDDMDTAQLTKEAVPGNGYEKLSVRGEDMMVSCVELENVDLKLISVIPYREFWSTALKNLGVFWAALALCIFVGVSISLLFSVWKQKTWGSIKSILKNKPAEGGNHIFSRDKEIAKAIEEIVKEYHCMQNQLDSVDSMKRELLLTSVLRGRIRAEEADRILEKNGVEVNLGNYVVILFRLNGFERFYDIGEQKVSEEEIRMLRQSITSIVWELNQKAFSCESLNLDEKIVCIVDFGTLEKEACYEQMKEFSRNTCEASREGLKELLTVSISDVHRHVVTLHKAYAEALRVMEYQMNMGGELVMDYLEMVQKAQISYLYSLEDEKVFIQCIYEGKEKEALQLFEEICDKSVASISGSEELNRCLIWNLTASVLRAESELRDRIELPDIRNFLESVKEIDSISEIRRLLTERIAEICRDVVKNKGKKDNIAEQVKEYIQEHFSDANLNNSEIAEYFHMNISYLSTFFKEKTGVNLLSYIHQTRLEKAKELLETTDMTLDEIGEKVGCNNKVSFLRLFKKYEGITPTEYRRKRRQRG